MIKKLLPILLCAVLVCGCTANMGNGGEPTPIPNDNTEWSETISTPRIQIKTSEAEKVLNELIPIMNNINSGTLYISDIGYMNNVCEYLAQYSQFNTEIAVYMESIRQLLSHYCSLYAQNIDVDTVREQINKYVDDYFGMTDEFRQKYGYINNTTLIGVMNKVVLLADTVSSNAE